MTRFVSNVQIANGLDALIAVAVIALILTCVLTARLAARMRRGGNTENADAPKYFFDGVEFDRPTR